MTALQTLPYKVLFTLLTLTLILLLTLLLLTHQTHLSLPPSLGLNLNHCPPSPNPSITTTIIFTETPNLNNPSHKSNNPPAAAAAAATPQWGGLWVQRNETYKQRWGISMFHALHCLDMIRAGVGGGQGGDHSHEGHDHHHQAEHVEHCFSYIAQTIICGGDGTIEPPWEETDAAGNIIKYGVDGEGYQHECRDTSRLWEASLQSEEQVLEPWDWQMGDTVESVELRSQG